MKANMNNALVILCSRIIDLRQCAIKSRGSSARLSSREWSDACQAVATECDVGVDHLKKMKKTVYSRILRGNLSGVKSRSPVADMEPILVQMCIMRAKMRQPLTKSEGIAFANSLLEGSVGKELLVQKHEDCGRNPELVGVLGKSWWYGFRKRYRDYIRVKSPVHFSNRRVTWATWDNFKLMYDLTYDVWVDCGIAVKLEQPVWVDRQGQEVSREVVDNQTDDEKKEHKYLICNHRLIFPEGGLNMDEVGHSTGSCRDNLQGNEKRISIAGETPQRLASETDIAWTQLAVTALTGEAVCCVVIIEGERFKPEDLTGMDVTVASSSMNMSFLDKDNNHGPGKLYPGGPKCTFRGKEIPAFITTSSSGGITTPILTGILEHLDRHGVYNRNEDGFTPTIQLDSHHTRFGLQFLEYCRNPATKWFVTVGCPEATHLWQIQDSSQMNGENKRNTYIEKEKLITFKTRHGMPCNLQKSDIIPIINKAWANSFAIVDSNKSAIAERGWNPPNSALLFHPDILATRPVEEHADDELDELSDEELENTAATSLTGDSNDNNTIQVMTGAHNSTNLSQSSLDDMNFENGLSGEYFNDLLLYASRRQGMADNVRRQKEEDRCFAAKAKDAKRLTAGFFFTNGHLCVTNDAVYNSIKERNDARLAKEKAKVRKAADDYHKLLSKTNSIVDKVKKAMNTDRSKYPNFDPTAYLPLRDVPLNYLTKADMSVLMRVLYRKKQGDRGFSSLPVAEMKRVWVEKVCMRRMLSVKEFLIQEKEYHRDHVESVVEDQRFPNLRIYDQNAIAFSEAEGITLGQTMEPLEDVGGIETNENNTETHPKPPTQEGVNEQARQDAMMGMMELAGLGNNSELV